MASWPATIAIIFARGDGCCCRSVRGLCHGQPVCVGETLLRGVLKLSTGHEYHCSDGSASMCGADANVVLPEIAVLDVQNFTCRASAAICVACFSLLQYSH